MKTRFNVLTATMFLAAVHAGFGQSTIQFTATSHTVAESADTVVLTVQRTNDLNTLVSVDYATADGTATNGMKYTAASGTLAFGASETNQTIVVPILNTGFVEGTKTFQVVLSNPTGGAVLGTRANATVSISDNDVGVQFVYATYSVAEEAGGALIGVVRGDDGTLPVAVDLVTTDLTATSALDYTGITNTVSFAPTERFKVIAIPIPNDGLKEGNETFRATLSNPTGGSLGGTKTTTVTIVDNDLGFEFESANCNVAEDAGAVLVHLLRGSDDANSPAMVDYATTDLTATNGLDYTGAANTLSFAPGERRKVVPVPILNDGVKEGTKTFHLTLSNPTGGVLGSRTTTTVTIHDNDPGLGFELGNLSVAEKAGAVVLTVLRGNDCALGPITVDYVTSEVTAKAGEDYQSISGTLEFRADETVKTLAIPIIPDGVVESTESFRVTLSDATGGAVLGTATATVAIQDTSAGTYVPLAPPFDAALAAGHDGEVNILTWTGGGTLQKADRPTGPWQTLTTARSPFTILSPVPATFYRVTRPRPVNLYVPSSYDSRTNIPLVILLHGWGATGAGQEAYMQFRPLAESRRFLYCYPDGMVDPVWGRIWLAFLWNATDASAYKSTYVDDAAYLRGLIEEIAGDFALDRKRVYLIGHSNGGGMAERVAYESADLIAGIANLAGPSFPDLGSGRPSEPVNVLRVHGTADATVSYAGAYPTNPNWPWCAGAVENIETWAGYNGSGGPVTEATASLDLTTDVAGLDTVVMRYTNCPLGGAVELWTINGGSHGPTLSSEFSPRVIDWLLAHPKP